MANGVIDELYLFANLIAGSKPIATQSQHFSFPTRTFIQDEITRLMKEDIIEHSASPWRAQVVVVKNPDLPNNKRSCIDGSQPVNQHTEQDAYQLPGIDDMITNLAKYRVFSTFDLNNAYHQFPI